jgi:hypothetical protein
MTNLFISLFILLLGYINCQCLATSNPNSYEDCVKNSDDQNYCCLVSTPGYQPAEKKCVQLAKNKFYGQNRVTIQGETWNMNCGKDAEPYVVEGGQCGNLDPIFGIDCWAFSTMHNSCCLYKSQNTTGTPACQWYFEKHSGNILSRTGSLLLSCDMSFLSISRSILIILGILFLAMV